MTPDQLLALGTAFAAFLRIFEGCVAYQPTVEHLHSYCRGLLSDLPRKSIEPIALACGTAVRTLQEFLRDHVWDHFRMLDRLQQLCWFSLIWTNALVELAGKRKNARSV